MIGVVLSPLAETVVDSVGDTFVILVAGCGFICDGSVRERSTIREKFGANCDDKIVLAICWPKWPDEPAIAIAGGMAIGLCLLNLFFFFFFVYSFCDGI